MWMLMFGIMSVYEHSLNGEWWQAGSIVRHSMSELYWWDFWYIF
jgi:hypothetical protein